MTKKISGCLLFVYTLKAKTADPRTVASINVFPIIGSIGKRAKIRPNAVNSLNELRAAISKVRVILILKTEVTELKLK